MSEFRIKQKPEDFVVREVMNLDLGGGRFAYYRLKKIGITTQEAVKIISKSFKRKMKYINYAGNKDKNAVAEQYISILHGPKKDLERENLFLEYLGQGRKRINLGDSEGNDFSIVIRNIDKKPNRVSHVVNYFDDQRFGARCNNHVIGRFIIKRDFCKAARLIPEIKDHLKDKPKDCIGALRRIPKRILRMFPNSYQSYLWNRTVSKYIERFKHTHITCCLGKLNVPLEGIENVKVPLIGYDVEFPEFMKDIIETLMKEEVITKEDFRIREMPEFDLPGNMRDMLVEVKNLKIGSLEDDELNPEKRKCKVEFFLPKGSYATIVIKTMLADLNQKAKC
ncbi:MAG: hypothetical protein DRN25_03590 [Thermoplasmata archaeon]|nr:MAG: hypothetical protein DRN25_03590 [Thermoplasmata archaeon]